jgi:glycosylphosphatidylinositol deacylase
MGGIVARLAATSSPKDSISLILTMATPHTISPAPFDYTTESIYRLISTHQISRPSPLLISVCGGISDTQVVSDTCALGDSDLHPEDGFTVFTSGLPGAWTGVDHQAMVWCHQIRWAVARALMESANIKEKGDQLLRLKRWLGDDIADRTPSALAIQKHTIPVTSSAMSVLARWDRTDLPKMSYCPVGGNCGAIEGNVSRIPWLRDETRPFPLTGEGVHGDDVASVVDLQLESGTGHLELEATEILGHGALKPMNTLGEKEWHAGK